LREHSDSVALRVRDALDHAAREWKIQQSHSLKERERQRGNQEGWRRRTWLGNTGRALSYRGPGWRW
jgi:hypothetical protein